MWHQLTTTTAIFRAVRAARCWYSHSQNQHPLSNSCNSNPQPASDTVTVHLMQQDHKLHADLLKHSLFLKFQSVTHKCTVIYTQKNNMAFHAPIFTELTICASYIYIYIVHPMSPKLDNRCRNYEHKLIYTYQQSATVTNKLMLAQQIFIRNS